MKRECSLIENNAGIKCKVQMVVEFDVEYTSEEIFERLYKMAIPSHVDATSANAIDHGRIKFSKVVKRSLADYKENK